MVRSITLALRGIANIICYREALCRDPWWIFTTVALIWTIKTQYELKLREIIRISPRFGIMLFSMIISIAFIILDILSVTSVFDSSTLPVGINPFWKLAFVFKCLTDMVVLDDFKTALDRLRAFKISRIGSFCEDTSDRRNWHGNNLVNEWESTVAGDYRDPVGELFPIPVPSRANSLGHGTKDDVRKNQKDSVHAPDYIPRDFGSPGQDPETMVPSNLYGPPISPVQRPPPLRSMATTHIHHTRNSSQLVRDADYFQDDYARAMKDIQSRPSQSGPSSYGW